jgi:hypothetical protein
MNDHRESAAEIVERLIEPLRGQKPMLVYIDARVRQLRDPDALSRECTVFRNGGTSNGVEARPFVEVTPELLAWLRETWSGRGP